MTNANWGLIDPNAFGRGYEQSKGMVDGIANTFRQGAQDNALRDYAMNPNDPNAVNALAQNGDPRMALQVRQQQQAAGSAKQERDTAMIANLARDAKDPATFDAAVDQVVAMGYPDAAQFKGKFSPGLRSALMAAGGIKDDVDKPDYTVIDGVAFDNKTRQPVFESPYDKIVSGPGGIYQQPRVGYGRGGQGAAPQGQAVAGPEIAPGWELVDEPADGGPTPQASGRFRPPGN